MGEGKYVGSIQGARSRRSLQIVLLAVSMHSGDHVSAYLMSLAREQRAELVKTLMALVAQKFAFIGIEVERLGALRRWSVDVGRSRSLISLLLCILSRTWTALLPFFTA